MPYKNEEDHRRYSRQWHLDNREKKNKYSLQYYYNHREKELKRMKQRYLYKGKKELFISKYGLTYKDWEGLWYTQDGRCAICDKFFAEKKDICIDHNHKTGEIRGLLCKRCNIGIGLFDDNHELLNNTVKYLKCFC